MLGIITWIFLLYAGWRRFKWWTPFAAFSICLPLIIFRVTGINSWRSQAELSTYSHDLIAANLFINLLLWVCLYWIGRGAVVLIRGRDTADDAIECFHKLQGKYLTMIDTIHFKDSVTEEEKMFSFVPLGMEFIRLNYPKVYDAGEKKNFELITLACMTAKAADN